jgi:hypothetical protein
LASAPLGSYFRAVTAEASYAEYLGYGWASHYGDRAFPVLQLLWPDKQHKLPAGMD